MLSTGADDGGAAGAFGRRAAGAVAGEDQRSVLVGTELGGVELVEGGVEAGNGGRGSVSFRREKFVPRGGPSGGDGGRGGDVWLEADSSLNTLLHLRYNPEHTADRGRHGEGSNRSGREGEDVEVRVPVGTQVVVLGSAIG